MTDRYEPSPELAGVKWFDNAHIMGMWDSWRRYIAEGGGTSWPRDAFECLLDAHDAEVEALRAERDAVVAKLAVERGYSTTLRARVAELEGALGDAAEALRRLDTDKRIDLADADLWGFVNAARVIARAALSPATEAAPE